MGMPRSTAMLNGALHRLLGGCHRCWAYWWQLYGATHPNYTGGSPTRTLNLNSGHCFLTLGAAASMTVTAPFTAAGSTITLDDIAGTCRRGRDAR